MPTSVQEVRVRYLRGSKAANEAYVGPAGELTIDMTDWRLRVHDGVTAGGHPQATRAEVLALAAGN